MRRRRRCCKLAKWLCAAGACTMFLLWLASLFAWFQRLELNPSYKVLASGRGFILLEQHATNIPRNPSWIPHNMYQGLSFGAYSELKPLQGSWRWLPRIKSVRDRAELMILLPLWLPLLAPIALALLLHRLDRRYAAQGWCYLCDYDRRTLPAGAPCPECGRAKP